MIRSRNTSVTSYSSYSELIRGDRRADVVPYTCFHLAPSAERSVPVTAGQLVVVAGLELSERYEFISTVTGMIDRTEGNVALDCSQLAAVDEGTLGMLVVLSRNASRRGRRLLLEMSSPRMRGDLDAAGV